MDRGRPHLAGRSDRAAEGQGVQLPPHRSRNRQADRVRVEADAGETLKAAIEGALAGS